MSTDFEVLINATPLTVWAALTQPSQMKGWMAEPQMAMEVVTTWEVDSPITITGFHHARFVNKGTVLACVPEQLLRYSQLSSISRLPNKPENYSIIEFELKPVGEQTSLTVRLSNFPTEVIFKHLEFYWRGTLGVLKKFLEK